LFLYQLKYDKKKIYQDSLIKERLVDLEDLRKCFESNIFEYDKSFFVIFVFYNYLNLNIKFKY